MAIYYVANHLEDILDNARPLAAIFIDKLTISAKSRSRSVVCHFWCNWTNDVLLNTPWKLFQKSIVNIYPWMI